MQALEEGRSTRVTARLAAVVMVVSALWQAAPAGATPPWPSCMGGDHSVDVPDLRLTVSPERRTFRIGEMAKVRATIVRSATASKESPSFEAEGITVMVILQSGWRRIAPHGLTDDEGQATVEVPLKKSMLDPGWVSAYIYAYRDVASVPCAEVREVSNVLETKRFFKLLHAGRR